MTSSTPEQASNCWRVWAKRGTPPMGRKALGISSAIRLPRPAAGMRAATRTLFPPRTAWIYASEQKRPNLPVFCKKTQDPIPRTWVSLSRQRVSSMAEGLIEVLRSVLFQDGEDHPPAVVWRTLVTATSTFFPMCRRALSTTTIVRRPGKLPPVPALFLPSGF